MRKFFWRNAAAMACAAALCGGSIPANADEANLAGPATAATPAFGFAAVENVATEIVIDESEEGFATVTLEVAEAGEAEGAAGEQKRRVLMLRQAEGAAQGQAHPRAFTTTTAVKIPDHWLGVYCLPVDGALRAQLNLKGEAGLVVETVMDDGPAAKAGIKQHDILLQFGNEPLKGVGQLMEVVGKQGEKETEVKLLRGGKEMTIKVTPAKRPETPGDALIFDPYASRTHSIPALPERPLKMQFFHPGVVVGQATVEASGEEGKKVKEAHIVVESDGVLLKMRKQGDGPAKFLLKRGDEEWSVDENSLDKLPEELRPLVKKAFMGAQGERPFTVQMMPLAQAPGANAIPVAPLPAPAAVGAPGVAIVRPFTFPATPPHGPEAMLKQIEDMHRMLHELRHQVEQMHRAAPGGGAFHAVPGHPGAAFTPAAPAIKIQRIGAGGEGEPGNVLFKVRPFGATEATPAQPAQFHFQAQPFRGPAQ